MPEHTAVDIAQAVEELLACPQTTGAKTTEEFSIEKGWNERKTGRVLRALFLAGRLEVGRARRLTRRGSMTLVPVYTIKPAKAII